MANYLYISESTDGHVNLAVDEYFLDRLAPDDLLLYFYVNRNAVIIGCNQNPWVECDLDRMRNDGVQLVRRITGGGAVFHDEGNLNFSFIAGEARYDLERQLCLILSAVRALGIACDFTGRNDLTANGCKFSGNAFCTRRNIKQHHGTLLVRADLNRLSRYLTVDPRKLHAKGTRSVRSRVCNLSEFCPELTVEALRRALMTAFGEVYGDYTLLKPDEAMQKAIVPYLEKQRSEAWQLGRTHPFDIEIENRFPWGNLQLLLKVEKGIVRHADAYTDAMAPDLARLAVESLNGQPFSSDALAEALAATGREALVEMAAYVRTLHL